MTLIVMEPTQLVSNPTVAHLCDVILETLRRFVNAAMDIKAFCSEVQTLRKFLDLIDRVFKAKLPRMAFEEQHFTSVEVLLERCRSTLSRLCEIFTALRPGSSQTGSPDGLEEVLRNMQSSEMMALRARIGFYVQTLQMSLQTVKLVHQWKSQLPQDGIYFQHEDLSEAIESLKDSVSCRKGLSANVTQHSAVEEETFMYDVDRCIFSAEVIMDVTKTTVYENVQSPLRQLPSELPGCPAEASNLNRSNKRTQDQKGLQPLGEPRVHIGKQFPEPPIGHPKPAVRRQAITAQQPKSSKYSEEAPIIIHLDDINAKRRGSFDSDCDSISDPEPEFEDQFPPEVYSELIASVRQEVENQKQVGEYQQAEQTHRRAMEYLSDRERKLGIPFDNLTEMHEILADIYMKQRKLDKAKPLLNRLLLQEKGETDRKWRLYHSLAEIYEEKGRLVEAEKFAKRAYLGRERSLANDDGLLLESVNLLARVYELQQKTETAEALRKVYRAVSTPPEVPEKSERRSMTLQSQLGEGNRISPSHVRWAPDVWVDPSSINAPTKSGETPLIAAITTGDCELVQLMLQRGADIEARCVDQITPLMHAVNHGHLSILEILLTKGAQVDATTAGWTVLHRAADMVNVPMVKLLLAKGADIEARSSKNFATKKHPLARLGSDLDDYDEVDVSDADVGWTALLRAATSGQEAVVRFLTEKGADLEARSPNNDTPLICAADGNHEAVVELLLKNGADVDAGDDFGWKPLHRVMMNRGGENVAQMLLTHGANINARCIYQKTPLHHAIEKGNDPMVSFLLAAGADYEARDIAERTPLHTAIESRLENMVHILLEAGADADAKDKGGHDALGAANRALRKSPEITSLLAKHKKAMRSSAASRQSSASGSLPSRTSSSSSWWSMRSKQKKRG